MKKIAFLLITLFQFGFSSAWAQQAFVVKDIQIDGLQNISQSTVETYLPIKRGQTLQPGKSAVILRDLYKTGFFDSITVSRVNNTLVLHVVERPIIGQLKVTGNSVLPTDKLTTVMRSVDVAEGRVYNPSVLEKIKQSLLSQYYQLGRYNARVDIKSSPMSRNRVAVNIDISEGLVAKVRRVSILGNHAFPEKTLLKQLDLTSTGLFTFYTQTDRYSEDKLESSQEKLRSYYLDHGYVHFEIKSAQAEVTPDRKSVYITIVVSEGEQYTIEKYELEGNLILPRSEYEKVIKIKPGDTFSRQHIMDAERSISTLLGDKGYLFANVTLRPSLNDQTRQVILVFVVNPGKRVYVRNVTFSDNTRTNDVVLRREVTQMESAPASTSKLEDSKRRLLGLPYIPNVDMSVNPVPESKDQVDINYKVKEDSAAQASFKVGYSQIYRMILGAGVNQKNFLGTGNTLGINFSHSQYEQFYGIDYSNPYYTADGISRSFNFAIQRTDPASGGINVGYTTHEYDAGVLYGIPIGNELGVFNRAHVGFGYQNTIVNLVPQYLSNQINDYATQHGTHFQVLDVKLGYSRDSRDKAVFPTSGVLQSLFLDAYAPLSSRSVSYYMLNYHAKWYQPITDQFIFMTKGDFGYGSGFHNARDFPFFRNFFAGGIDSVRGYQGLTLGPLDSIGNPMGGNILADASISLIFPNHLSDNLRTSTFFDAGNVYTSYNNRTFGGNSNSSGSPRYSVGLEADWLSPFGPIEVSVAQPLNVRKGDHNEEVFQFALGANF